MSLTVVEVLERSKEGRTEPYICRCDDGEVYFVKGRSATRNGLIAEWICAELATALSLPIAPYFIANVPIELIEADTNGWLQDLGSGAVFASQRVCATNLTRVHLDLVPKKQRCDILMFDWWIHNGDRNLTGLGGNCNLLWTPENDGELILIDHNLAFESDFLTTEFINLHVFADEVSTLFSDFVSRDAYTKSFHFAMLKWSSIWDSLPKEWAFIDDELTIPNNFPYAAVKNLLDRSSTDDFWLLPS